MRSIAYSLALALMLPLVAVAGWQQDFDDDCAATALKWKPSTNGLVDAWAMNGTASYFGTHNLTVTTSLTNGPNGTANTAYFFSGTKRISYPITGFPTGNTPHTVSMWIWGSSSSQYHDSFFEWGEYGAGTDPARIIGYQSSPANGNLMFNCWVPDIYPLTNTVLSGSAWTHVCNTFDGTNMMTYFNGTLVNSIRITTNLQTQITGGSGLYNTLGDNAFGNGALINVRISQYYLYSRVLPASEVLQMSTYRGP